MQQCPIKHHTAIKTQSYTAIGQRREVEVFGLEYIVSKLNAEVRLRIGIVRMAAVLYLYVSP